MTEITPRALILSIAADAPKGIFEDVQILDASGNKRVSLAAVRLAVINGDLTTAEIVEAFARGLKTSLQ